MSSLAQHLLRGTRSSGGVEGPPFLTTCDSRRLPDSGQKVPTDARSEGRLCPLAPFSNRDSPAKSTLTDQSVGCNLLFTFAFFEQAGISCRVAEGRALGRHGNRIGIIYLHRRCQLSPGNGDHEIRVSEIDSHFPSLFSHSEKGFCVNWVFFPGSSRSHRKKSQ